MVWRLEDGALINVSSPGCFFEADAYIALKTVQLGPESFSWDIFFWLGAKTSTEEQGMAAVLAVELDEVLGDAADGAIRKEQLITAINKSRAHRNVIEHGQLGGQRLAG